MNTKKNVFSLVASPEVLCIIKRYLFCIKDVKPSHFHDVIQKEVLDSHSKENYFVVSKMHLDHCSFYMKTENYGFVLFHLNVVMTCKICVTRRNSISSLIRFSH